MFEYLVFDFSKVLIVFVSILPIIYWYLTRKYNYWSKQGISGPKPVLIFGNFLDRVWNNMAVIDVQYLKQFGNVYGIYNGTEPVLEIADPDLIKQILVKDFHRFSNRRELRTEHPIVNINLFNSRDDIWKKVRTITSSTFTSGKMKKLYPLVRKTLGVYLENLDEVANSGQHFNAKMMHECFTMDVIASAAFATQTNALKEPNSPFIMNSRNIFIMNPFRFVPAFVFPKFINNLLNIKTIFDPNANEWLISLLRHVLEKRRQSGDKNNDFLQLLIDAKEDDNKNVKNEDLESQYLNEDEQGIKSEKKNYANNSLTEDEIIGQCWVFLLAGFETTATTLGFMSYELALNPECQQKLYNEVKTAMDSDNEISYDDLHRLPYLDACINETLRKYPPVTRLEREVNQNFKLGDSEIKLFKGQLVEIPVYAIQHSEKYFPNAEQFNPDRFLKENRNQITPYTFMPFGTGPRNCIGMRFALMEIKLAMTHIINRFKFTKCDKTEKTVEFQPLTPLLSPKSVTVGIEFR